MRKELNYFYIDGEYGGDQDWFRDPMMKLGGCGAATAMDSSICFDRYKGTEISPLDVHNLTRKDYVKFSKVMKPYLSPRWSGINRLDIYIDGYGKYLRDRGEHRITMTELPGRTPEAAAFDAVKRQIDGGYVIPALVLFHRNPAMRDYVWHWFIVYGYEEGERNGKKEARIRTATYGDSEWVDFHTFWDTGYDEKGGMVLYHLA